MEISTLLDIHARYGVLAIAQVDLWRRAHRHQNIHDLGAMAVDILAAANCRCFPSGNQETPPAEVLLRSMDEDRQWAVRTILTDERPRFDTVN